jgi:hypothetical protein
MYPNNGYKGRTPWKEEQAGELRSQRRAKKMPARRKIRLLSENALFWDRLYLVLRHFQCKGAVHGTVRVIAEDSYGEAVA